MQFEYTDNGQKGEFFSLNDAGQRIAEISYAWRDDKTIVADHTWVDDSLRGQNVGRLLVDQAVEFARTKDAKILPLCPFAKSVFDKEPSLHDVLFNAR